MSQQAPTTLELEAFDDRGPPPNSNPHPPSSLPPTDGGTQAWTLLLSAFLFEALLWGFPLSFGIFAAHYSTLPTLFPSPYIAIIGTTASGLSYTLAPFIIPLLKRYSTHRRTMIYIGWPLCLLGLVAGSFAKTLGGLVVTQGVAYGLGFTVAYYPVLAFVNEYWVRRRGFAYGVLCSASGVSGAVMPFAVNALLNRYGYPTTLRIIAASLFVLTGPLLFVIKGRGVQDGEVPLGRTDWGFLKKGTFWMYSVSNFAMGLGYFFPGIYLPSYAVANGLGDVKGAVLLALMSVTQVLGQMSFGYLSDGKVPLNALAMVSTMVSGVAVYACWGLAHSFSVMIVFSLLYGFFGAGYTALWGRMGMAVSTEPTGAFAAFGFLNFGKGIGNMLAGPVGGALLKEMVDVGSYGTERFGRVVLFTGACMVVSGTTIAFGYLKRM
jgi:MFS family permease